MKIPFISSQIAGKFQKVCLQIVLVVCSFLAVSGLKAQSNDNVLAEQVSHAPLFQEPLIWLGPSPSDIESQALLAAIDTFKTKGIGPGFTALEQFVAKYPHSGWTPALEVHIAEHDRACGRYSEALKYWQMAWDETKDSEDKKGQELAVRTIAGWTRLLASLGEKEQLKTLFGELASRHFPLGTYATEINETKEGLQIMDTHPGWSYRCGSYALGHLAEALKSNQAVIQRLFTIDSPDNGFTISELLTLAKTNGLDVEAVQRPLEAPLVVPCVVHWKLNHYAAILEEKDGRYRVADPTFEHDVWMNKSTIDAEASGDYIIPTIWQWLVAIPRR